MSNRRIAVLIDGGFFLKRLPKLVTPARCETPERIAGCIRHLCRNHVKALVGATDNNWNQYLYRVFYYDAAPYDGKAHHPIDNRPIDFAKSDVARQRLQLFECLRKQRKFALRMGKVNRDSDWIIKPELTKKLLRTKSLLSSLDVMQPEQVSDGTVKLNLTTEQWAELQRVSNIWGQLESSSVTLGLKQKGVDMRIGIDIASLALKKQVDTIVLVAGDSDFVPAAKLARREGIDFILDPLWQQVNADLFEHIDGLQSGLKNPNKKARMSQQMPVTELPDGD